MAEWIVIALFLFIGGSVVFVAFSGGPSAARRAYLTGGRRGFTIAIVVVYIAFGAAVPALVLAGRPAAEGTGALAGVHQNGRFEHGKTLFRQTCWSCHSLGAINAHGITGPNLDQIGQVTDQRVLNAIRIGGTGDGRMPSGLLQGKDAQDVAYYVSHVAGR